MFQEYKQAQKVSCRGQLANWAMGRVSSKKENPRQQTHEKYHQQAQTGNDASGLCLHVYRIWRLTCDMYGETDTRTDR